MNAKIEALEELRRKIENAYYDRCAKGPNDYPPFALTSFQDRPRYHAFIMKLLQEEMDRQREAPAPP